MNRRRRVQAQPPPQEAPAYIEVPENFQAFDAMRTAISRALTMASETKGQINQVLFYVEQAPEDERWEPVLTALDEANDDFARFFRSAGRALGYMDPRRIEEEPEG